MIFQKSAEFIYKDRGCEKTLALLPGWATDNRIFSSLNSNYNYILPVEFCPWTFNEDILRIIEEKKIKKLSILGFSLGGFAASKFAVYNSELVEELILIGIRKRYDKGELLEIRKLLNKNKNGYLYKFYNNCFFEEKEKKQFKNNFFRQYCEKFSLEYLLDTLNYFEEAEINLRELPAIKNIKIIHGEYDRIAPLCEARALKSEIPAIELIILKETGHIPFFRYERRLSQI